MARSPQLSPQQVSDHCFAITHGSNRLCDANSGFISLADGVLIDTQSDLAHASRVLEWIDSLQSRPPGFVINTHEDLDHVWGNQLISNAEIIAHRTVPDRMREVADPRRIRALIRWATVPLIGPATKWLAPGLYAMGQQLAEGYEFANIQMTPPTRLFDERLDLDLGTDELQIIYVGPAHQMGDVIVHLPSERVVFAGDLVFRDCTPAGWAGTFATWLAGLERIRELQPTVIVPGHGPTCGTEGLDDMRDYIELVLEQAKTSFDRGLNCLEAATQLELGRFESWRCPARAFLNVARAYREFQGIALHTPWNMRKTFDGMYMLAVRKGWKIEF